MKITQILTEVRQSKPLENLVESTPVKEEQKLSKQNINDFLGLGWLFVNEDEDY